MKSVKHVRDFIYRDITTVNENSSLRRVIRTMKLHRTSAIPIVNQLGEYIGCICEQDILHASVPDYMKSIYNTSFLANLDQVTKHLEGILDNRALEFVDTSFPTVEPNDSMSYAADLLYRTKRNVLPVVENDILVGLITRIEILAVSIDNDRDTKGDRHACTTGF